MADQAYMDELDGVVRAAQDVLPTAASPICAGDGFIVLGAPKGGSNSSQTSDWYDSLLTSGYLLVTGSATDALFSGSVRAQLQLGDTEFWTSLKIWLA